MYELTQESKDPIWDLDADLETTALASDGVFLPKLLGNVLIRETLIVDERIAAEAGAPIICLTTDLAQFFRWPAPATSTPVHFPSIVEPIWLG